MRILSDAKDKDLSPGSLKFLTAAGVAIPADIREVGRKAAWPTLSLDVEGALQVATQVVALQAAAAPLADPHPLVPVALDAVPDQPRVAPRWEQQGDQGWMMP